MALVFAVAVLIWQAVFREGRGGFLTVAFLDVGQGDAIFIEAPNGNQVLIDGGPNGGILRELGKLMSFYDRSIDALVVSNPDADHIAGFVDVIRRYKVGALIEPGTKPATAVYRSLEESAARDGVDRIIARRGDRLILDERRGIVLDMLFPDADASGFDTNEGSLVTKLSYGDSCFLMMGDAPRAVEGYLVSLDREYLKCQLVKAGHHGSKTSSSDVFVGAASPRYAVISSGAGNRYGHPHNEVLETFERFGVKVLRTDLLGSVIVRSDGLEVFVRNGGTENRPAVKFR